MQFLSGSWFWVIALVTATAYAAGLYYRNTKDELAKGWRILLACLRFGFVFFICFLFFSPLVKLRRERIEKPLCFLVLDQSSSMGGAADTALLVQRFKEFSNSLSKRFNVQAVGFGLDAGKAGFAFNEPATDFGRAFDYIQQRNVGNDHAAVVLFSDGNNNMGQEAVSAYRRIALPLYTVGFGDTNRYPDIFIEQAVTNLYAYKGNNFPVRVLIGQHRAPQATARLSLREAFGQKRLLKDTVIPFQGKSEQTVEWNITTQDSGICRYILALEPIKDEYDTRNNRRELLVRVLENRQKILVLAHAPHPDLGCLHRSLQTQEKYSTDVVLAKDLANLTRNPDRLESYDLIVLHGLPSERYPLHELKPMLERKPLFYLLTASTSFPLLNKENAGVSVQPKGSRWNEAQAHFNPGFSLFNISTQERALWERFPPLQTPFALYNTGGGQSLFTQNILQLDTEDPLLWISAPGSRRTAVCFGTQFWKWRLADFQETGNTQTFDHLFDKCLQLLCQARPESNLTVHCPAAIRRTEALRVQAFLYNAAFEKVKNAPVRLHLNRLDSDAEYRFDFVPENDHYALDAGFLPEGDYRYTAQATVGDETYRTQGSLSVSDPQLENPKLPADHALLRNLSLTYQGRFFYGGNSEKENPAVWKELAQELLQHSDLKPRIRTEETYVSPLNRTWLLVVLLTFLSFEYFARKRFGNL
ncbi:MAG: VWA domain-containing protein [Bacteroides sp.]|nr:VWA domain-containing protein [Bacteroides sp.]